MKRVLYDKQGRASGKFYPAVILAFTDGKAGMILIDQDPDHIIIDKEQARYIRDWLTEVLEDPIR